MADIAIPEGPAQVASSPREEAPPSSAGSPLDAPPAAPPALSDEVKARLDKIIYSDVSDLLLYQDALLEVSVALHVRIY